MPYRDQRAAVRFLLSQLRDERARLDEEIEAAKRQLKAHEVRRRFDWRRVLEPAVLAAGLFMLAGGVLLATDPCFDHVKEVAAGRDLTNLQSVVDIGNPVIPKGCTRAGLLIAEGYFLTNRNMNDPWGTPYRIGCEGDEARVSSAGPDSRHGTEDDLFGR